MGKTQLPPACLLLTPQHQQNMQGLELLTLEIWSPKNIDKALNSITAVSGQPGRQDLLKPAERSPGSMRPIPEGKYNLGPLEYASGVPGDFSKYFGGALGPIWCSIIPAPGNPCQSFDFGIHADWNQSNSPGSAGCVTIQGLNGDHDLSRLKTISHWWMSYNIEFLYVHYNKGWTSLFEFKNLLRGLV